MSIKARYNKWSVTFDVQYDARKITKKEIIEFYKFAGIYVGLMENRNERGGCNGMFRVTKIN